MYTYIYIRTAYDVDVLRDHINHTRLYSQSQWLYQPESVVISASDSGYISQ